MKILLDSSAPALLARFLTGHQATRTGQLGWQSLENGKLLTAAEQAGFDVLITCDQIYLSSNHWPTLRPVAGRIATMVDFAQRGQMIFVDIDSLSA